MLAKRIIPCLDVKDGQTVKGINFKNLVSAGDPVELAKRYAAEGADELVFLDISATQERRKTLLPLVEKVAEELDIPFTVGGGVRSLEIARELLERGADKVTVNSAAVTNPFLLDEISSAFGSQALVLAVDAKIINGEWIIFSKGGSVNTGKELLSWIDESVQRGVGEVLFTSMNADGTKAGFEIDGCRAVADEIGVPVIASGGAGKKEDFLDLFNKTQCTGALAASIFHFGNVEIGDLKKYLKKEGVEVRLKEDKDV